ncbi:MAG: hypothetical protein J6126_06060 [Clostridia bacterium]|nr:hypothetical protein [Clostridia bacterium]
MKKNKKKREEFEDDGRVIVPMNVDGMPWYDSRKVKTPKPDEGENDEEGSVDYKSLSEEEKKEYRKETRRIIRGVLAYFMPFVLAFVAVFAAVILLLTFVWK